MDAKPYLDRGCNHCPANCHEFNLSETTKVQGQCGETKPQGGCYGLVFVPYRDPAPITLANIGQHVARQRGR